MTAPHRPLDKERAFLIKLGEQAGLDPMQIRDLRNDLTEQGYPLMVIANTLAYNQNTIYDMMSFEDKQTDSRYGGGIGRVHGFMRGACARQLEWLLADLIEMGHTA